MTGYFGTLSQKASNDKLKRKAGNPYANDTQLSTRPCNTYLHLKID